MAWWWALVWKMFRLLFFLNKKRMVRGPWWEVGVVSKRAGVFVTYRRRHRLGT